MKQFDDEKYVNKWLQNLLDSAIQGFIMTVCGLIRSNMLDMSARP